jgi:hypothetical protein
VQYGEPAELDTVEAGLKAAGIPLRDGKVARNQDDPPKWRQYLLGVWRRHQDKAAGQPLYQSKLLIAQQLLTQLVAAHPSLILPVPFDNWDTQPAFCRLLHRTLQVPYVGTLAEDDQVLLASGATRLAAVARHLHAAHQHALTPGKPPVFHTIPLRYKGETETYDSDCHTHRIHNCGKQRFVINHRQADLSETAQFFISNHLT